MISRYQIYIGSAPKLLYPKLQKKYGKYCRYIASNILHNDEDSEECVNDTYLRAWNSIPPNRPSVLKTFLGKITRNLSLDRYELLNAKKRNGGQMSLIFDEIQECIPSLDSTENIVEEIALTDILNRFLSSLSLEQRKNLYEKILVFIAH